jgi:hypothetical protein
MLNAECSMLNAMLETAIGAFSIEHWSLSIDKFSPYRRWRVSRRRPDGERSSGFDEVAVDVAEGDPFPGGR